MRRIFPHIEIETIHTSLSSKNVAKLLGGDPSYVIDCTGDPEAKAILIDFCIEKKYRIVTTGETTTKANPSFIQIADIKHVFSKIPFRNSQQFYKR